MTVAEIIEMLMPHVHNMNGVNIEVDAGRVLDCELAEVIQDRGRVTLKFERKVVRGEEECDE